MTATNKASAQKANEATPLGNTNNGQGSPSNSNPIATRSQLTNNNRAFVGGRDVVMMEFMRASLDMTRTFMESQERVMMAYLSGVMPAGADQGAAIQDTLRALHQSSQAMPRITRQIEMVPSYQQLNVNTISNTPNYQLLEYDGNGNGHGNGNGNGNGNGHGSYDASHITDYVAPQDVEIVASSPSNPVQIPPTPTTSSPVAKAPGSSGSAELDPEQLIVALVEIVSQRTGYPPEMLDPTLDLEADLGIDSIKRVEILNNFRKMLPEEKQNSLEDGIEKLAGVKTLQGIMDWIRTDLPNLGNGADVATTSSTTASAGEIG